MMTAEEFRSTDLAFAIEALHITMTNEVMDQGLDILSEDILEVIGYDLYSAGRADDSTAIYTHLLRVVRWVYEHDAMTDAMRVRVDEVPKSIGR